MPLPGLDAAGGGGGSYGDDSSQLKSGSDGRLAVKVGSVNNLGVNFGSSRTNTIVYGAIAAVVAWLYFRGRK